MCAWGAPQGVTFACINAAALAGEDAAAAKPADKQDENEGEKGGQQAAVSAGGKLGTFAFRVGFALTFFLW